MLLTTVFHLGAQRGALYQIDVVVCRTIYETIQAIFI